MASLQTTPRQRRTLAAVLGLSLVGLTGCSTGGPGSWSRLGLPEGASDRTGAVHDLWINTWIAAAAIGVLVWGLILWAAIAYRRRSDRAPKQTRYNLPMEIMYTAVPFLIIGVLFYWTIRVQDEVNADSNDPDVVIDVVGQQWSWTFNYRGPEVYDIGTIEQTPTLVLPVDQKVRFNLTSPDVIHSFWVPAFYFKRDVIPGNSTSFELTPTRTGTFAGKCAELCGTYHSAMLFNVRVVTQAEYEQHLQDLRDRGQTGVLLGQSDTRVIAGTSNRTETEPDVEPDDQENG